MEDVRPFIYLSSLRRASLFADKDCSCIFVNSVCQLFSHVTQKILNGLTTFRGRIPLRFPLIYLSGAACLSALQLYTELSIPPV